MRMKSEHQIEIETDEYNRDIQSQYDRYKMERLWVEHMNEIEDEEASHFREVKWNGEKYDFVF